MQAACLLARCIHLALSCNPSLHKHKARAMSGYQESSYRKEEESHQKSGGAGQAGCRPAAGAQGGVQGRAGWAGRERRRGAPRRPLAADSPPSCQPAARVRLLLRQNNCHSACWQP